jgi:hypothetical protein
MTTAGVLNETFTPIVGGAGSAPGNGIIYGFLLGLYAGDVVTGILVRNSVQVAGTLPTTVRFGIADSTGKMLATTGNQNALVNFPGGACPQPLSAQYTALTNGGYFACGFRSGAWGTTDISLLRGESGQPQFVNAFGANATPGFDWAGQADLPTVGNSLTLTTGPGQGWYIAFY